ncbi:hypothetical protein HY029_02145 [Candidatus Gottesmanbacteria bacterium]|nr:hypothetical protein [Candidatus Gottesmanbacteria bacterium]
MPYFFEKPQGKTTLHSIVLGAAVVITFFWVINDKLSLYSLQLSGLLLLTLVITHRILKPTSFKLVESTVSTMAVLLVTQATGGIGSPLFFLNYFLLFELSLLLEAVIPMVLSVFLIFFYFFTNEVTQTPFLITALLAFPCMTPLAYYFGKIYNKEENQKRELKSLNRKIVSLEEELVEEEIKK